MDTATIVGKATVVINTENDTLYVVLPNVQDEVTHYDSGVVLFSDAYEFVKSYILTAGVVKDSTYWDKNIHDEIVTFLTGTSKYERRTISFCLAALGY